MVRGVGKAGPGSAVDVRGFSARPGAGRTMAADSCSCGPAAPACMALSPPQRYMLRCAVQEKRKRDAGKQSRGKNYVEEEKRRARDFGIFSGEGERHSLG